MSEELFPDNRPGPAQNKKPKDGKTKKSRGPSKETLEQLQLATNADPAKVNEIFEYWKLVMKKRGSVKLDVRRQRRIGWALATYGEEDCKRAIRGCSRSDFHMGNNRNSALYNDIDVIFRSAEHVERFISYATVVEDDDSDW